MLVTAVVFLGGVIALQQLNSNKQVAPAAAQTSTQQSTGSAQSANTAQLQACINDVNQMWDQTIQIAAGASESSSFEAGVAANDEAQKQSALDRCNSEYGN